MPIQIDFGRPLHHGLIYCRAKVSRADFGLPVEVKIAYDTGASQTVIDSRLLESVGYEPDRRMDGTPVRQKVETAGGPVWMKRYHVRGLRLLHGDGRDTGWPSIHEIAVLGLDFERRMGTPEGRAEGLRFVGLLGLDVICRYHSTLVSVNGHRPTGSRGAATTPTAPGSAHPGRLTIRLPPSRH